MNLYEQLDVPIDATPAEIKAAHRRKAREHHPDRGGDPSRFQAIQLAYDTLKDEQKRRRYDETGETSGASRPDPVFQKLAVLFNNLIDHMLAEGAPVETTDMRAQALTAVKKKLDEVQDQKDQLDRMAANAKSLAKRFKRKRRAKGPDMMTSALEAKSRAIADAIRQAEEALDIWRRAEEILSGYEYTFDPRPAFRPSASTQAWTIMFDP
jgi:curved DNA-binding protein CbpA